MRRLRGWGGLRDVCLVEFVGIRVGCVGVGVGGKGWLDMDVSEGLDSGAGVVRLGRIMHLISASSE